MNQKKSQNYYTTTDRYKELVNPDCKVLEGPYYAIIREEFYDTRNNKDTNINSNINNILITFGGNDYRNLNYKVIQAILELNKEHNYNYTVVNMTL